MNIEKLHLRDFRNYESADFEFCPTVNVIWGENGRGKTNVLESVYMLSGSRSWRGAKTEELIGWDKQAAFIQALVFNRGRDFRFDIRLTSGQKAKITVNDVPVRKKQAMSEVIKCVLFSPEDLLMIKGGAANRRSLMDECLCQKYPFYSAALSGYELILKNKQRLLRDSEDYRILPELNMQLATYGADIILYRSRLIVELEQYAQAIHSEISGGKESLNLCYKTMLDEYVGLDRADLAKNLYQAFCNKEAAETASKSCLIGVHRDDIEVYINTRDARKFASQGQARTAAIALKFAEREILQENGDYPLLLLDDVLSELDEPRQKFILKSTQKGQTIITCCVKPTIFDSENIRFMNIPQEFIGKK